MAAVIATGVTNMRSWPSFLIGTGLLLSAGWLLVSGSAQFALACLLAGGYVLYQGYQKAGSTGGADPLALVDLVTDPAGALVDAAIERADGWLEDKSEPAAHEKPQFDVDGAFERYMAGRADPSTVDSAPAARGFGRKGLPS
ncbi:hypothetical protein [Sphingomonas arenae]|uniref:hypothetical protein n=2 Tax=Sphingomonas arenae TaxID=2812555 RepID=UPI00196789AE|nr:hypothetical protein [Sphingomonas arenae]